MKYDLSPPIIVGEKTYDSLTFASPEVGAVGAHETAVAQARLTFVLKGAAQAKELGLDVPPYTELVQSIAEMKLGDIGEFDAGMGLLAASANVPIEVVRKLSALQMSEAQKVMDPLLGNDEGNGGSGDDTPAK